MKQVPQTAGAHSNNSHSAIRWFWLGLVVTTFVGLGPVHECLAYTVTPTTLTFTAVQGAENPPTQLVSVYRKRTSRTTLTNSDNAGWLIVSPATMPMTTFAQLTVAVDTSGLAAGTYNATISVRIGTQTAKTVSVALVVSPPQPPTTANLAWDPVTSPTLDGYKVYIGTVSGLYTRTITVGNVTSYTVDSLTTGTTYYFSITAYNSVGESPPSNEVSKHIY